jgi:hypothetical protein
MRLKKRKLVKKAIGEPKIGQECGLYKGSLVKKKIRLKKGKLVQKNQIREWKISKGTKRIIWKKGNIFSLRSVLARSVLLYGHAFIPAQN